MAKEIEECRSIEGKRFDELILHKNYDTFEIEGVDEVAYMINDSKELVVRNVVK